jgi:hypothetical protein
MKRVIPALTLHAAFVLAFVLTAGAARATEVGSGRPFGVGFAIGSPVALVGKAFLGSRNAIDFGLGSFARYGRYDCDDRPGHRWCSNLTIHADYLWQEPLARGTANLDWHIGVGGRLWFGDSRYEDAFALAGRMPFGLDLTFARPDMLEIFLELAPALYIAPAVGLTIEALIGPRIYF